ncbi:MAG TPA: phosphatase PAP2 family protein [Dehalococcoidia bacterium]|nr:phosphatase PAP2 family protein [Dehalococcoidia bacterium]
MARSDSLGSQRFAFLGQRRVFRDVAELALVGLAFLLYFVVRANVIDRPEVALENARSLVDVEQSLGIYAEASWQQAILNHDLLVRFFNFVYFWLDFPLIAALGIWMYLRHRPQYTFTRDAILFSGALALVAYNLLPVAPPRLLPESGMIDTLQVFNNASYQAQSTEFFVNPYAALPSLHVGWAVLAAMGMVLAFPGNRLVVVLAFAHVLAQSSSTVFTGNHYFLDGAGGLVAAAGGLAFAVFMQRRGYSWLRRVTGSR